MNQGASEHIKEAAEVVSQYWYYHRY
jgi:hypothetical protein